VARVLVVPGLGLLASLAGCPGLEKGPSGVGDPPAPEAAHPPNDPARERAALAGVAAAPPDGPVHRRALVDPRAEVRRAAIRRWQAAEDAASPPALASLRRGLRDPVPSVRVAAVETLVGLGSERAVLAAVGVGPPASSAAIRGLGELDGEAGGKALLALLRGRDALSWGPACAALLRRRARGEGVAGDGAAVGGLLHRIPQEARVPPACVALAARTAPDSRGSSREPDPGGGDGPAPAGGAAGTVLLRAAWPTAPAEAASTPGRLAAPAGVTLFAPVLARGLPGAGDWAAAWLASPALDPSAARALGQWLPRATTLPAHPEAAAAFLEGLMDRPGAADPELFEAGQSHEDARVRCAAARIVDRRRGWPGDLDRCGGGLDPVLRTIWNAEAVLAGTGAEAQRRGWLRRAREQLADREWARRALEALEGDVPGAPPGSASGGGAEGTAGSTEDRRRGEGRWRIETTAGTLLIDIPARPADALPAGAPRLDLMMRGLVGARARWDRETHTVQLGAGAGLEQGAGPWFRDGSSLRPGDVLPGPDGGLVIVPDTAAVAVAASLSLPVVGRVGAPAGLQALRPGDVVIDVSRETAAAPEGRPHQSKGSRGSAE